jgi:hypothetical protein
MVVGEVVVRERSSQFFLFDRLIALFVIALVLSLSEQAGQQTLKVVIVTCAIFSTMVIVEAIAVWFKPEVLDSFVLGYWTETGSERVVLGHPLEYLGLTAPGILDVIGHPFARFRSFVSEPAGIVATFFVPGLIALTFPGAIRFAGVVILIFAVGLSGSGTVFLSAGFGCALMPVLWFLKGRARLAAMLPFILVAMWYVTLLNVDARELMTAITQFLEPLNDRYSAFDKTTAGLTRMQPAAELLMNAPSFWLVGTPDSGTGGLLLHLLTSMGVTSFALGAVVCYRLLKSCALAFRRTAGVTRVALALFYGTFVQVMLMSEFGWITTPGFLMLTLAMLRLELLARSAPNPAVAVAPRRVRLVARHIDPKPAVV